MHVPAYCPVDEGVQDLEYSGVDCEFTKTICIDEEEDPISIMLTFHSDSFVECVSILVPRVVW